MTTVQNQEFEESPIQRARRVYRENGATEVLRRGVPYIYEEYVRPRLPKHDRVLCLNSVEVHTSGLCTLDRYVPWYEPKDLGQDDPEYERSLIDAIRSEVNPGDEVVIVGGGWGVTSTVAANQVGQSGAVTVFEGAGRRVQDIHRTLKLNDITDIVNVEHAIVGDPVVLTAPSSGGDTVSPGDLPPCDVLEMDCEGAETNILPELEIRPRVVIVETHRNEAEVERALDELGYSVVATAVEKPDEIFVLTALRDA